MAREGYLIEVRCIPCGHVAMLDPKPLAERFGDETCLIEASPLYRFLRCSHCGSRVMSLEGVKGAGPLESPGHVRSQPNQHPPNDD